jgi:hypothetical protein
MSKKERKHSFKGKTNRDAKRQKDNNKGFGYLNLPKGTNLYTPKPGSREEFDIIPYIVSDKNHPDKDKEFGIAEPGTIWYKRPFKVHRQVGADNEKVVCLSSFGKKCFICEYRKKRAKEGADKDELQNFNASSRNLYVVKPKNNKNFPDEFHVLDFSQFNFQDLLNDEIEENEKYESFPDLEDGLTLKVRWDEEVFAGNKFAAASRIDFLERKKGYSEDILDEVPDLDKLLKELTYEQMEAKFLEMDSTSGEDNDEEDDEEDDETPFKDDKKKSKKVTKPEPDDDEEDDEYEDSDEEDDEEDDDEAPKKKTSKKVIPKLTWDDLDDMDESELTEVIESKDLDIDPDDYDKVDELKKAVAEELDMETPKKKSKKVTKPEPDDDEDEDDDDEPVQKKSGKTTIASKTTSKMGKNKCPNKHEFGVDTDKFDECDDCTLWDKCIETKERK